MRERTTFHREAVATDERPARNAAGIACACLAAILLSGCSNLIRLPETPSEVRKIYLMDHGRHTRLAFESPAGNFVEYGYGEWQWYAKLEDRWWRVPAVLFWPTRGTLGRRQWPRPGAETRLLVEYAGLTVLELAGEKRKVDTLVAGLAREFDRQSDQLVRNRLYGLDFVPHDRSYWLFNNSNHAVKDWLEASGFEVSGSGILADWRYAE